MVLLPLRVYLLGYSPERERAAHGTRKKNGHEFDAAKTIVDTLKDLEKLQQERALGFASEALGLSRPLSSPPATAQPPGAVV
jgi:hypothetical protein